jgi:hypothetical protein
MTVSAFSRLVKKAKVKQAFLSRVTYNGLFLEGPAQLFCVCISACKRCFSSSGPQAAPG